MSRQFTPKVVTANALLEGDPIYLTADDRWSRNHAEAELLTDEVIAETRLLFAMGQPGVAVGPYLADARAGRRGPEPVHHREAFRTTGPSNYSHGPQAKAGTTPLGAPCRDGA